MRIIGPILFSFLFLVPLCGLFAGGSQESPGAVITSPGGVFPGTLSGSGDGGEGTVSPSAATNGGGTILAVPPRDQLKKNALDEVILAYLETGSPSSIRLAIERINNDPRGMTEENRVALAVSSEVMKLVYPLEKIGWTAPSVPDSNPYIGALRSARMGTYDYNTGNSDFLALVLPSIVLFVSSTPGTWYGDAEASLLKAASMRPSSVLPPLFLGLLYERQGKTGSSSTWYKKAWDIDSSCYPAGLGYGISQLALGNPSASKDISLALRDRYPDSMAILKVAAETHIALGAWDDADPLVLEVLRREPDNAPYLLHRARILVERKEYLKANALLDAYGTHNRTDKNYLLLRSRVLREWNKNPSGAVAILQDALGRYPDDPEVQIASAEVSYLTGLTVNKLGGRDIVLKLLQSRPDTPKALELLSRDYIQSGEWAQALKTAERLMSLQPGDASSIILVTAQIGNRQFQTALSRVQGMYQGGNTTDEVTSLYLQALIGTGATAQARTLIASRMNGASSSLKSILYYHESLIATDGDGKLASLRSSLLADPRNSKSLLAMYEWYFERKDYRKAQYYLKQVSALEPQNGRWTRLLAELEDLLAR